MIELRSVSKKYGKSKTVVDEMNLTVFDNELLVLIGESGCGKTTTLQMINRLVEPTKGSILIDGKDISEGKKSTLRRRIGYVIQNTGLFPHRTIEQNIATVPLLCGKKKKDIQEKVYELMKLINLPYEEFAKRYPCELSGGQQQRVGVARALANDPDIILMDEPFSALDPLTREQLQDELLRIHEGIGKTIVFVTHDINEAIKLGDRIAIMEAGKIVQLDTPEILLKAPANDFVRDFIGHNSLWNSPNLLKAEDVMLDNAVTINPTQTVKQAIDICQKYETQILVVTDSSDQSEDRFLGLISIRGLRNADDSSIKVKEIMKRDIPSFTPDTPLTDIMVCRDDNNLRYIPVVDENGQFQGLIADSSIVNTLSCIMPGKEAYSA